jgi:cell volume regulation protein A
MLVLLSMSIQGSLLPWVSKKLDMIDHRSNVLKTFNDFVDEETLFGKVEITDGSEWLGKSISQLNLPQGLTIALVIRDGESIMPGNDLVLKEGDTAVTLTKTFDGVGAKVKEKTVKVDSRRVGKPIYENPGKSIIIMIKRDDERIIPNDRTILQAGDQLVILDLED